VRLTLLSALFVLGFVDTAFCSRFPDSNSDPAMRFEKVFIEGGATRRAASDFQNSSAHRVRGGSLFGIDASIALSNHCAWRPS
jgi:hypothetical protein